MTTIDVNGHECETGCVFDSHFGWHNTARLIHLAQDLECMTLTEEDAALIVRYDSGDSDPESDDFEIIHDMSDEAEKALNEHTPKGFLWLWSDGDFFLSTVCDDEEYCSDETCAHWSFP